jgi:hypothetical protein
LASSPYRLNFGLLYPSLADIGGPGKLEVTGLLLTGFYLEVSKRACAYRLVVAAVEGID